MRPENGKREIGWRKFALRKNTMGLGGPWGKFDEVCFLGMQQKAVSTPQIRVFLWSPKESCFQNQVHTQKAKACLHWKACHRETPPAWLWAIPGAVWSSSKGIALLPQPAAAPRMALAPAGKSKLLLKFQLLNHWLCPQKGEKQEGKGKNNLELCPFLGLFDIAVQCFLKDEMNATARSKHCNRITATSSSDYHMMNLVIACQLRKAGGISRKFRIWSLGWKMGPGVTVGLQVQVWLWDSPRISCWLARSPSLCAYTWAVLIMTVAAHITWTPNKMSLLGIWAHGLLTLL